MTRRNQPPPASVRSPKRSHSREGSENPQGRRVGSRVDPARGLVPKSIRNAEVGSSGCRQHRTARHGQRTPGDKTSGKAPDLLRSFRVSRWDFRSTRAMDSVECKRAGDAGWMRGTQKSGRASHAAAQRQKSGMSRSRQQGRREINACRDGLIPWSSPSQ
jgi:hypothetical protein